MRVGDLVKDVSPNNRWAHRFEDWRGIILREINGTEQIKVVMWTDGKQQSLPARNLELVSAGR